MATVFFESASELATLSNTFSVSGTPTDPTAVTLVVTDPLGAATTYNWPSPADLTHGTAGVFSKDIACATAGTWQYVWTGTGTASDATVGTWDVLPTSVGKLYATVEALKSRLSIPSTSTVDDYELHAACHAASRAVEHECDRHFWRTPNTEVRTFTPCDLYLLRLPGFNDVVSVATLKTDTAGDGTFETTWTASQYQLLPVNPGAAPETRPYTKIRAIGTWWPIPTWQGRDDLVQITGVFGWPAVPRGIQQAALIVAAHTFRSKDAPLGVASFGDLAMRVQFNRSADTFLGPYRRNAVLVA